MQLPDHIRSFASRQGRHSAAQKLALIALKPRHSLEYQQQETDWRAHFSSPSAALVLEIGSGMGEATAQIAASLQDKNFVACEVYPAGVSALLKRIEAAQLPNLKVLQHDAFEVVRDMIAEQSLDGIHVFFPDPWHKARHNKRRLIQPAFAHMLALRLRPGAYLHLATDWVPYAEHMMTVLRQEPLLRNRFPEYAPKPSYRTLSKFENRGVKLGHEVRDLIFERV